MLEDVAEQHLLQLALRVVGAQVHGLDVAHVDDVFLVRLPPVLLGPVGGGHLLLLVQILLRRVVIREEGVLEALLHGEALVRVDLEHVAHEVARVVGAARDELLKVDGLRLRQPQREAQRARVVHELAQVRLLHGAHELEVQRQHLQVRIPAEEHVADHHLRQDAPRSPDVHLAVVVVHGEHDLRRAVPPRHHVVREELLVREHAAEPEVAEL
mmetsp:Transcript_21238/g.64681  ORF Transcript_21238/g.64681 Transcript_21238/m.64681 type:complete len:213 (-) Transcript_21238:33-671(-)